MRSSFANSHPGHKRRKNEDAYAADPECGIWLVADGVGGHVDGEIAAATVRETLLEDLASGVESVDAILHAHRAILEKIATRPDSNMGSTVVALLLRDDEYTVTWVGDSRAYLFDGNTLRQLTRDHNPVSEMLACGAITPEQAASHPERHKLSQFLGVDERVSVNPDQVRGRLRAGEQIVLCSDGLSDELSDAQILDLMREQPSPTRQVECLIEQALNAGGRDNITVIVVGDKAPTATRKETEADLAGAVPVTKQSSDGKHHTLMWLLLGLGIILALWSLW